MAEGNAIASVWMNVMSAASAQYEVFNVEKAVSTWLTKLKTLLASVDNSDDIVLIADEQAMHAAAGKTWKAYMQETQRFVTGVLLVALLVSDFP